MKILSHKRQVI